MTRHSRLPILHPRVALVILVITAAIGTWGALEVRLVEDVASLLPSRDEGALEIARRSGLMNKVMVVVGPASPRERQSLHAAIDAAGQEIAKLDGVGRVIFTADARQNRDAFESILKNAAALYRPGITPIAPDDVPRRLAILKTRLASPEALAIQEVLLADPLGFGRDALKSLEAAGAMMGTVVDEGHLLSKDRRFGMVVAELDFDPMEVTRSASFIGSLDRVVENENIGKIGAFALGGPHFVVSSASAVSRDIRLAFALTAVLVVAVFFWFFRKVRTLPLALLPGGVGILVAAAVMGFAGVRLHALTLGFAATITGISVDYVIHLLHRAGAMQEGTTGERMSAALDSVARPVILGCLTTVGSFGLVAMSGFTGIRQMAIFSIISLPTALAVTLFVVPPFHAFALRGRGGGSTPLSAIPLSVTTNHSRTVVAVFLLVLGAGVWLASKAELSGDPRALGYSDPVLLAREAKLKRIFQGASHQTIVLASGSSEQAALEQNDALYQALRRNGIEASDIASISPFLPSEKTERASRAAAKALLGLEDIRKAFAAAGFTPEYLADLKASLKSASVDTTHFQRSALLALVEDAIGTHRGRHYVLTRVKTPDDRAVDTLGRIAAGVPGCRLVSERLEARAALTMLQEELIWMLAVWFAAAVLLLTAVERSPLFGLRAALPAVTGVVVTVGVFSLLGRALTPVASAGLTLVMGLGIDYGIFMQTRHASTASRRSTAHAVIASALTTLAAFGVLSIARTRAMADIGLIILIGVTAALATSLFVVPALVSRERATR